MIFQLLKSAFISIVAFCIAGCSITRISEKDAVDILDVQNSRQISYSEFQDVLAASEYILLGEQHDQAAHHQARAEIITQLAEHWDLLVSFEHVSVDKEDLLIAHLSDVSVLPEVLDWKHSGWPAWSLFEPLFKAVQGPEVKVVSAKRPESGDLLDYGLQKKNPNIKVLRDLLRASHHHGDGAQLTRFVRVQRVWDAGMASSLDLKVADKRLLLAGNGHVRKDFGVPWYLKVRHPKAKIVSVGFATGNLPEDWKHYDYIITTGK